MPTDVLPTDVLLVDDDDDVRRTLRRFLERRGWRVTDVGSATEAMNYLADHQPDLVVSDYDMPDQGGLDLFQWMRAEKCTAVRVLLTGHADLHLALHTLNRGLADRFITKPWEEVALFEILRDSVARRGEKAGIGVWGKNVEGERLA